VHLLRILLAAVAMLLSALVLWLLVGITSAGLGVQSPTFALVSVGVIAVITFATGGFLSARYITPRSWLHPVMASLAIVLLYLSVFTAGDVGALDIGFLLVSAVVTAGGAILGRHVARPPNISSRT
jgi:hypothetical protein